MEKDFTTFIHQPENKPVLDKLLAISAIYEQEPESHRNANAMNITDQRYRRKVRNFKRSATDTIEYLETYHEMLWRVVVAVMLNYAYDTIREHIPELEEMYKLFALNRFVPNSPTWTGAGTPLGQLSACFVLPIIDDLGKEPNGIFRTLLEAMLIQQGGGGVGYNFSHLREKGALIKSSNGESSGAIAFGEIFDYAVGVLSQGGVRRGAQMWDFAINHPEIEDFIKCKATEGKLRNFNISVLLTDDFMRRVKEDLPFDLVSPHTKEVVRTVRAVDLWNLIVENATRNGEPGCLFIDTANRANPLPNHCYLESTNPCVTADTVVLTANGPLAVSELVGKPCELVIGDERHKSALGFYKTGKQNVNRVTTAAGYAIRVTDNHRLGVPDGEGGVRFVEVSELRPGDAVVIYDQPNTLQYKNSKKGLFQSETLEEMNECLRHPNSADAPLMFGAMLAKAEVVPQEDNPDQKAIVIHFKSEEEQRDFQMLAIAHGLVSHAACHNGDDFTLTLKDQYAKRYLAKCASVMMHTLEDVLKVALIGCASNKDVVDGNVTTIASIEICGEEDVYDVAMEETLANGVHYYVANGFLNHNCGEQWLPPYGSCNLGSINLANCVRFVNGRWEMDWEKLEECARLGTIYLNRVIDANRYVPTVPKLRELALKERRIGLGFMGLADLFIKMGVRYGSFESYVLASKIMGRIYYSAMKTSIAIAKEHGESFPYFKGSIYDFSEENANTRKWEPLHVMFDSEDGHQHYDSFDDRTMYNKWYDILEDLAANGMLWNSHLTTIAPTGTITTSIGVEGYGCEPLFALAYEREVVVGDNEPPKRLIYFSELFDKALRSYNLEENVLNEIGKFVKEHGSCQGCPLVPEEVRRVFVTAHDVTIRQHVMLQAVLQRSGVDNSISKTINCPPGTTKKDVSDIYWYAYEMGCKGITVYVNGSREKEVLHLAKSEEGKEINENESEKEFFLELNESNEKIITICEKMLDKKDAQIALLKEQLAMEKTKTICLHDGLIDVGEGLKNIQKLNEMMKNPYPQTTVTVANEGRWRTTRPPVVDGRTGTFHTPVGKMFMTMNHDTTGAPYEVFINAGKGGTEVHACSEAIARLLSLLLKMTRIPSKQELIQYVCGQLRGIGGQTSIRDPETHKNVMSIPDAIANGLQTLMDIQETRSLASSVSITPTPMTTPVVAPKKMANSDICPNCHNAGIIIVGGCPTCQRCGYSKC